MSQRRTSGTPSSRITRRNNPSTSWLDSWPVRSGSPHSQSCSTVARVWRPVTGTSHCTACGTLAKLVTNPTGTVNTSSRPWYTSGVSNSQCVSSTARTDSSSLVNGTAPPPLRPQDLAGGVQDACRRDRVRRLRAVRSTCAPEPVRR
jgi:hypothetical protein